MMSRIMSALSAWAGSSTTKVLKSVLPVGILKELLKENSKVSSTRLMSLLCVIAGIGLAFTGLLKGSDLMGLAALCGVFIGAGLGAKVAQKSLED